MTTATNNPYTPVPFPPDAHARSRAFRSTRLFAGLQRRHLPAAVVAVGAESPAAAAHSRPAAGHRR